MPFLERPLSADLNGDCGTIATRLAKSGIERHSLSLFE